MKKSLSQVTPEQAAVLLPPDSTDTADGVRWINPAYIVKTDIGASVQAVTHGRFIRYDAHGLDQAAFEKLVFPVVVAENETDWRACGMVNQLGVRAIHLHGSSDGWRNRGTLNPPFSSLESKQSPLRVGVVTDMNALSSAAHDVAMALRHVMRPRRMQYKGGRMRYSSREKEIQAEVRKLQADLEAITALRLAGSNGDQAEFLYLSTPHAYEVFGHKRLETSADGIDIALYPFNNTQGEAINLYDYVMSRGVSDMMSVQGLRHGIIEYAQDMRMRDLLLGKEKGPRSRAWFYGADRIDENGALLNVPTGWVVVSIYGNPPDNTTGFSHETFFTVQRVKYNNVPGVCFPARSYETYPQSFPATNIPSIMPVGYSGYRPLSRIGSWVVDASQATFDLRQVMRQHGLD